MNLETVRADIMRAEMHLQSLRMLESAIVKVAETKVPFQSPRDALHSLSYVVALEHGVMVEDLTGNSRAKEDAQARQDFMWKARQMTKADGSPRFSFPQIGRFLNRDHTSVMHGVEAHAKRARGIK